MTDTDTLELDPRDPLDPADRRRIHERATELLEQGAPSEAGAIAQAINELIAQRIGAPTPHAHGSDGAEHAEIKGKLDLIIELLCPTCAPAALVRLHPELGPQARRPPLLEALPDPTS